MKKNYKQPNTFVIKLTMQSMIAATGPAVDGTTNDPNSLLSRRRRNSCWDEEEEETDF